MTNAPTRTDSVSEYIEDFGRFIAASPSSYHAAAEVGRRLENAGFARLSELEEWPTGAGKR